MARLGDVTGIVDTIRMKIHVYCFKAGGLPRENASSGDLLARTGARRATRLPKRSWRESEGRRTCWDIQIGRAVNCLAGAPCT